MPDRDFTFVIERHLGVLNRSDNGWTRELNIVSWNNQPPKYDIRDWDPDHERMSKGITLLERDMRLLVDLYIKDRNRQVVSKAQEEQNERNRRRREGPRSRWQPEEEHSQAAAEAAEAEAMEFLAGDGAEAPAEPGAEYPAAGCSEGMAAEAPAEAGMAEAAEDEAPYPPMREAPAEPEYRDETPF